MTSRRPSTPDISSSPPPASLQAGARAVHDFYTASSPHSNPSPTQTLGYSSPELPPLPQLPARGFDPQTPSAASRQQSSDASYYTASWGSPYAQPPPSLSRSLNNRKSSLSVSGLAASSDNEGDSPDLRFGLSHLLPTRLPLQFSATPSNPSSPTKSVEAGSVPADTPRPSRTLGNTSLEVEEDWSSELSSDDEEDISHFELKTPRLKGVKFDSAAIIGEIEPRDSFRRHKSRKSNLTLRQEDVCKLVDESDESRLAKMHTSKYADLAEAQPPAKEADSAPSPIDVAISEPASEIQPLKIVTDTASSLQGSAPSPVRSPNPRAGKKVIWKGKACRILLPTDPPLVRPFTSVEVTERLDKFAQAGYDIRGFGHWAPDEGTASNPRYAQNRDIYPSREDLASERQGRPYGIKIPIKQEWEAYMEHIMEQKLKALGVSLGDEPAPEIPLSRQSSNQYPALPFSPPPLTSSANSQRTSHGRTASVFPAASPFMPGMSRHASAQSIASPMSMIGGGRGSFHMHRHSTFTSPIGMPQHQPVLGYQSRSPQPFPGYDNFRTISPSMNDGRSLSMVTSPDSLFAFPPQLQQFPFPQRQDLLAQVRQQAPSPLSQPPSQPLSPQPLAQLLTSPTQIPSFAGARATPTLPELVEENEEEEPIPARSQTPPTNSISELAVATPQPRGHRHNISMNLERELRNGHYHLEEAINRQFGNDDSYPNVKAPTHSTQSQSSLGTKPDPTAAAWEMPSNANQPTHAHRKSSSLSQSKHAVLDEVKEDREQDMEESLEDAEIQTNPSLEGKDDTSPVESAKQHAQQPSNVSIGASSSTGHAAKASHSTFNVEAKEFKFNPAASFSPTTSLFNPSSFASSGFSFQPAEIKSFVPSFGSSPPANKHASQGSGSRFNVAAPAFTPSAPVMRPAVPSGDFSFIHAAESFKPDVPAFVPGHAPNLSMENNASETPNKIFGTLKFTDMTTPARRSRAIPIIQPEVSHDDDMETDDEDGRLMPSLERQKRARKVGANDDDVPRFASPFPAAPTPPPARTANLLERISNAAQESRLSQIHTEDESARSENGEETEEVDHAHASRTSSRTSARHRKTTSNLSAQAPPFEFRPGVGSFSYNPPNSAFSTEFKDISTAAHTDEPATPAFAVSSPPTAIQPSEDSIFSPERTDDGGHPSYDAGHHKDDSLPASPFRYVGSGSYESDNLPVEDDLQHDFRNINEDTDVARPEIHEIEPSLMEINEVMAHLNAEGSDFGIEKDDRSWPQSSSAQPLSPAMVESEILNESAVDRALSAANEEQDVPYASKGQHLGSDDDSLNENPFSDVRGAVAYGSPVHRLNATGGGRVSDWDDIISDDEALDKINARGSFFDNHINDLIGNALHSSLAPLEKSLQAVQLAVAAISTRELSGRARRSMSGDMLDSDADDEDDEDDNMTRSSHLRHRSPQKDRKLEKFRQIVLEALATQPRADSVVGADQAKRAITDSSAEDAKSSVPALDLDSIKLIIESALAAGNHKHVPPSLNLPEIRQMVEDTVAFRQPQSTTMALEHVREVIEDVVNGQTQRLIEDRERTLATEADARIADLERNLMELNARVVEEAESRKVAEKREADAQRLLKLAEEEVELLKASAEDDAIKVRKGEEDRTYTRKRLQEAEARENELRQSYDALSAENTALSNTLDEYRVSSKMWREDVDRTLAEKSDLRKSLNNMRFQAEEAVRTREAMRVTLQAMRADMVEAAAQVADQKALWHKNDEEREKRYEVLTARIGAEARTRERLEQELERLESRERDGMKHKVLLEQTQNANVRLEEMLSALRLENLELEKRADRSEREFQEAREAARVEVQRTRILFEADVEAANTKVNIVRAEMESEVERVRQEMENLKMDTDTAKAKHELLLEEAEDARRDALQRAHENREEVVRDLKTSFEQRIEELQLQHGRSQASRNLLRETIEQKDIALRDQQAAFEARLEEIQQQHRVDLGKYSDVEETLSARDATIESHRQAHESQVSSLNEEHARALGLITEDKERLEVHSKERLEIANSKIEHLQDKIDLLEEKLEIAKSAAHAVAQAKLGKGSVSGPERSAVNTQALRESISVLQEQLQEREGRIEKLEHQLSKVDDQLPLKLKERETEVTWLRELLGVRVDDLSDLITQLSQPTFNRSAVRDAAIRIRTNLQMEQQEKERLISGGAQSFPTLATISNFASPKAVQLAAAIGNWRKGREVVPSSLSYGSASSSRTQTPSKPPSTTPSFLSGLMTPPTSNLRRTPDTQSSSRPLVEMPSLNLSEKGKQVAPVGIAPPRTPPLLRRASYDRDADARSFDPEGSTSGYYDDDESTVDGHLEASPGGPIQRFEPFGAAMSSS